MMFLAQLPPGTQEAVNAIRPVVDHASQQGFAWYFAFLFFFLIGALVMAGWFGVKVVKATLQSKFEAEERQHQQFVDLAKRLREVEDSHKAMAQQFARELAELQTRSVRAMEDVAETLREIKDALHHK